MSASTFRKSCGAADLKQEPNACGHAMPNLQDLSVCHNMLSGIRCVMQRWRLGKLGDLRRMTISNHCNRLEAEDRHAAGSMVYIVAMKQNAHAMTITSSAADFIWHHTQCKAKLVSELRFLLQFASMQIRMASSHGMQHPWTDAKADVCSFEEDVRFGLPIRQTQAHVAICTVPSEATGGNAFSVV